MKKITMVTTLATILIFSSGCMQRKPVIMENDDPVCTGGYCPAKKLAAEMIREDYRREGYVQLRNKKGEPVWVKREDAENMKRVLESEETYYGEP